MNISNWMRKIRDVKYDILVYPSAIVPQNMTPEQGEEYCNWFFSKIPERMEYFRRRCALDQLISPDLLDYSPESLVLVWRWFLGIARTEKTPQAYRAAMESGAKIFGESYIPRRVLSVISQFILHDIAMYVGECFVRNKDSLYWCYIPLEKEDICYNQPAVSRFRIVTEIPLPKGETMTVEGDADFHPIHMVGVQAARILHGAAKENDLYNIFMKWLNWAI